MTNEGGISSYKYDQADGKQDEFLFGRVPLPLPPHKAGAYPARVGFTGLSVSILPRIDRTDRFDLRYINSENEEGLIDKMKGLLNYQNSINDQNRHQYFTNGL